MSLRRDTDRARGIARWMDRRFVDPILGFVAPGVGDAVSSGIGLYTVGVAIRHRLPAVVIARMLVNLGVDAALGAIPIVGDLFDLAFRAHSRNLGLLERAERGRRNSLGDWAVVGLAALVLLGALIFPLVLIGVFLSWIF